MKITVEFDSLSEFFQYINTNTTEPHPENYEGVKKEVNEVITSVGEALLQEKPKASKKKKTTVSEPVVTLSEESIPQPTVATEPKEPESLEEFRSFMLKVYNNHGEQMMAEVLKKYGARFISEMDPAKYAQCMAENSHLANPAN